MWSKQLVEWQQGNDIYMSIPFTWNMPKAYSRCVWYKQIGQSVTVGGPAVSLIPDYLRSVATIGTEYNALSLHNPDATFTSRGCIRSCGFCAVPKIEGEFRELDTWEAKPIVCDNNLLACSRKHFERVIDSLKTIKDVDFNQGLDCRLLTDYHLERIKELNLACVRFAWDNVETESQFADAINKTTNAGIPKSKIRAYILIGFKDTPDDALYRLETARTMGIQPNPQRYQPLNTLAKDSYVASGWTNRQLMRYMRYWARQNWLSKIPFIEYVG